MVAWDIRSVDMVYSYKKQQGLTLIELIISMGMGMVAISAILFFYLSTLVSSSDVLKKSKLNQELVTLMDIMVSDIRRAGVSEYNADLIEDPTLNVFNTEDYKLSFWSTNGITWSEQTLPQPAAKVAATACITFSYDRNLNAYDVDGDGDIDNPLGSVEKGDLVGFRLNNSNIEMFSGALATPFTCNASGWTPLLDANEIKVTKFTLDVTTYNCINKSEPDFEDDDGDGYDAGTSDDNGNGVLDDLEDGSDEYDCTEVAPDTGDLISEVRSVEIVLEGELVDDSEIALNLVQKVRVRNDRFYFAP